jgi:predicted Rossmann fold nucleotide-binding protein DprA/Smf involved in DNA uptake
VMGTGIDKTYPAETRALAARLAEQGTLISQFWQGAPPHATSFALRNVAVAQVANGPKRSAAAPEPARYSVSYRSGL